MESQRQRPQEMNELGQVLAGSGDFLRKYGAGFGIIAAIAIGAMTLIGFMRSRERVALERSWSDYFDAAFSLSPQPAQLQRISQQAAGTPVQAESLIFAGNTLASEGIQLLFVDREDAIAKLNEASAVLSRAATFGNNSFHGQRDRALLALGRCQESLGKIPEALQSYKLVSDSGAIPYAAIAKERITALGKKGTADFYNWLASYQPPAPVADPGAALPNMPSGDQLPSPLSGNSPILETTPNLPSADSSPLSDSGANLPASVDAGSLFSDDPASETPVGEVGPASPAGDKPALPAGDGSTPAVAPPAEGSPPANGTSLPPS